MLTTDPALYQALFDRRSGKAHLMSKSGPDNTEIEAILLAAARAPDHGRLVPFRFILIEESGRGKLADVLEAAQREMVPSSDEPEIERAREKAHQGPALVGLVARIDAQHPKITASDQWLTVGCALENMILAAQSQGYACAVRSGKFLETNAIRRGFNIPEGSHFVSIIAIGTPTDYPPARPKPELSAILTRWNGT